ncbi:hypothetical protein CJD36_016845 [Flavipsychrobacter stenotrophus]|uniref:Uncharacterized protein n=1 Tax=Flavipsychrobacter stenotrophus TaxID=2077091 RepID=A0A2S7SSM1_9BACT|nr:hypothetical protein CJD36_016845 [Flavipsychrobacter stenotrophus]
MFWLTSDNPGFSINLDGYDNRVEEVIPNPYCTDLGHDTILYFPLTKNYCLEIGPFLKEDDVNLNSFNIPVTFMSAPELEFRFINLWTYLAQQKFVVSCDAEGLKLFAKLMTNPSK